MTDIASRHGEFMGSRRRNVFASPRAPTSATLMMRSVQLARCHANEYNWADQRQAEFVVIHPSELTAVTKKQAYQASPSNPNIKEIQTNPTRRADMPYAPAMRVESPCGLLF